MSTVSSDPIADMLTRIRNAIAANKAVVSLPHSKVKEAVASLLKENHFIDDFQVGKGEVGFKNMELTIHSTAAPARITEIVRLSTPGRRWYSTADKIPVVKRGRGIVIVSTSKGLMTDAEARNQHLGGELICKVY